MNSSQSQESDQQQQYNDVDSHQIKLQYWQKWLQWVEDVRKERFMAVKMLQFQNLLEERLLLKTFKYWQEFSEEQKFQKLLRLKDSLKRHEADEKQEQLPQAQIQQDLNIAVYFHKIKTYTKCMNAWMQYGISCEKFEQNLSKVYIKFLLKKYFNVIQNFKLRSQEKKAKKAQTSMNITPKKERHQIESVLDMSRNDIHTKTQSQFVFGARNYTISNLNTIDPYKNKNNETEEKFPQTAQNFRELLNKPNTLLRQSRRSQFSSVSAQMNYESKRRFKPITELPSIPDLEGTSRRQDDAKSYVIGKREKNLEKSPVKLYESMAYDHNQNSIKGDALNTQKNQTFYHSQFSLPSNIPQEEQNPLRAKVLEWITKEKLASLLIMNSQQFVEGMQFQNYRDKTITSLKKLKDLKVK